MTVISVHCCDIVLEILLINLKNGPTYALYLLPNVRNGNVAATNQPLPSESVRGM